MEVGETCQDHEKTDQLHDLSEHLDLATVEAGPAEPEGDRRLQGACIEAQPAATTSEQDSETAIGVQHDESALDFNSGTDDAGSETAISIEQARSSLEATNGTSIADANAAIADQHDEPILNSTNETNIAVDPDQPCFELNCDNNVEEFKASTLNQHDGLISDSTKEATDGFFDLAAIVQHDQSKSQVANGVHVADPIQVWSEEQNAEEQDLVPDEIDSDSALGTDTESETTSLAESIWHFRMEHGRTYHAYKDGKYIFPNDERESDRLDMQHHLLTLTYGDRLFFSPLNNPRRCVDIGTGTGIWAIDFADQFPGCEVLGVDLSPNQPSFVPPNLKFVVDDAEDLWLYDRKFDFIHLRLMAGCFADWPKFFRQAYENLEPGGWLEIQDYGLPVKSFDKTHVDTDVYRWGELLCEAGRKTGRPLGNDCYENYRQWMTDAGFVDIREQMFMWPINGWPKDPFMKELGRWNQINILDGLEGFCLALLTRGLGWKKQEVDIFVAKVSADLKDKKIHAYFPMPVTYARKPLPGEVAFT